MSALPITYGVDAVRLAEREHPHLFPRLDPLLARPPDPPHFEEDWPERQRVGFLVEAYASFLSAHFLPYVAVERALARARAAMTGNPQGRPTYEKLRTAAAVMSGEAWGELEARVKVGKLPREIAPHSWLLWRMQSWALGRAKSDGAMLTIERAFSASDLLSEETLRVFTHTAPDPVLGSVRGDATLPAFVGSAYRALKAREQLIYRLGYSRDTIAWALRQRGEALADYDLRALHEREREAVREFEERLRSAARRGTWVWGRWVLPARPAGRRQQRLTTSVAQGAA